LTSLLFTSLLLLYFAFSPSSPSFPSTSKATRGEEWMRQEGEGEEKETGEGGRVVLGVGFSFFNSLHPIERNIFILVEFWDRNPLSFLPIFSLTLTL
jgi:hypothetical protein